MITWITKKSWTAVAASRIGGAHVQSGVPCQDSSRVVVDSGNLIACVADGAGSARHSDKGSSVAVDTFVTVSKDRLKGRKGLDLMEVALQGFEDARQAVLKVAEENPREYATTFLGLIATKDEVVSVQVGDGAVIVDGELASDPDSDENSKLGSYVNETRFITERDVAPMKFSASKRVSRVALMTDGLENVAIQNNGYQRVPHMQFFDPMFEWLNRSDEERRSTELGEFLESDRIRAKTSDDVTLLLAMR